MNRSHHRRITVDEPAVYQIEFLGVLDRTWEGTFGDLQIEHQLAANGAVITRLSGEVPDQAALAGVLNLAYSLRLPLLSVVLLDDLVSPTR